MQGQCYTVNGKSFLNKFSALRCAKQENAFAEFHIPQWHLDAFESVSVKDVVAQSPEYWIDYKIEKLFEQFKLIDFQFKYLFDLKNFKRKKKKNILF